MVKRILGLDILRSIAILVVLLMHSGHFLVPLFKVPVVGIVIRRLVGIMNFMGELGVELFFNLSGFLIGTILIKTFLKTDFDFKIIKNFWIRRWFRTLPNYYLFLFLNVIFFVIINRENLFYFEYIVFLQNFTSKIYPFFKESWSLAIEEWFYLTLPPLILILKKIMRNYNPKKILFVTFLIYFLIFFIHKTIAVFSGNISETRGVVIYRLDTMIIGVFMSYFVHYYKERIFYYKNVLLFISVTLFIISFVLLIGGEYPGINLSKFYWFGKLKNILLLNLFAISFSLLIPYFLNIETSKNAFINKLFTLVSEISYSLYLIHFSILDVLLFSRFQNDTVLSSLIIYFSYMSATFGLSLIIYKYYEMPLTKLREKLSNKE